LRFHEEVTVTKHAIVIGLLAMWPLEAQLPPLIDRDLFFGEIEISGAKISPDGKYI